MATRLSLLGLPLVLFQQILGLLFEEDYDAFLATRLVSAACRNCSDPLFFRNITLRGQSGVEEQILSLLNRDSGKLARNIRHIDIRPSAIADSWSVAVAVRDMWMHLWNLQSLSWNTSSRMLVTLMDLVETRPSLGLYITSDERDSCGVDQSILSSPNLYSLDYTMYHHNGREPGTSSEFHAVTSCLFRAKNLKKVRLQMNTSVFMRVGEDFVEPPLNLHNRKVAWKPTLEELTLDRSDEYDFSPENCQIWLQRINWSHLRKLNLGYGAPQHLLAALTGHVPQLKRLSLSIMRCYPHTPLSKHPSPDIIKRFLASIDGLTHIRIWSFNDDDCRDIRPTLLAKHGKTLNHVDMDLLFRDAWEDQHFDDLAANAPSLRSLSTSMKMSPVYGKSSRFKKLRNFDLGQRLDTRKSSEPLRRTEERIRKTCWPTRVQQTLNKFSHLITLSLNVQLQHDSYQYVRDTRPAGPSLIDHKAAVETVTSLFKGFGKYAPIEMVTVAFHAVYPGEKIWTYTARKKWNDKAQKYKVEVESKEEGRDYDERGFDPFKP